MPTEFKLVTSKLRKHIILRINRTGELEFCAPEGFSYTKAQDIIALNEKLITKLRIRHEERKKYQLAFHNEMQVYLYGKLVTVHYTYTAHAITENGIYVPGDDEETVRKGLTKVFKAEARKYLPARVEELAKQFGITYTKVKIGSSLRRWGCCNREGRILFSWRLMQIDKEVIDYIIIHELAHRLVFDHSGKFWKEVEKMKPDYEACERYLDEFPSKKGAL